MQKRGGHATDLDDIQNEIEEEAGRVVKSVMNAYREFRPTARHLRRWRT